MLTAGTTSTALAGAAGASLLEHRGELARRSLRSRRRLAGGLGVGDFELGEPLDVGERLRCST